MYNMYNDTSNIINKLVFTPTTIMELPNFHRYAFVINNMYFNSHKRLVFMISTKEINLQNNISKKLTQIPCGKFRHVRFDIDDLRFGEVTLKTLEWLWDKITADCSKDKNSKITIDGIDYKYCGDSDKPLPQYPDVCNNKYVKDLTNSQDPCTKNLTDLKIEQFEKIISAIKASKKICCNPF